MTSPSEPSWLEIGRLEPKFELSRGSFHLYYKGNAGTRPTIGPAIQFENLLPGNLCQSADLFRQYIIFTFHK